MNPPIQPGPQASSGIPPPETGGEMAHSDAVLLQDLRTFMENRAGWKIAVAESLTTGHVQTLLGRLPGSSAWFAGGVTAYRPVDKARLLSVDPSLLTPEKIATMETALAMAAGVISLFGVEIGLATTGYATPDPSQQILEPMAAVAWVMQAPDGLRLSGQSWASFPSLDRTAAQEAAARLVLRLFLQAQK